MDYIYDNLIPSIAYFVERKCSATWHLEKSTLPFYDLTYVYAGKATYLVDNTAFQLKKGDFIFISKGQSREAFTDLDDPMHCFAFNFDYVSLDGNFFTLPFNTFFHIDKDFELLELYKNFSNVWLEKGYGYKLKARAIFMLIFQKLSLITLHSDMDKNEHKCIKLVKDYIFENYPMQLDIEKLSSIANLNPVYLGYLFKKQTGFTVNEYINRIRVNAASNMLSTGGYNVAEAAYRCGFNDPYYFSKTFKRITGKSPSSLFKIG